METLNEAKATKLAGEITQNVRAYERMLVEHLPATSALSAAVGIARVHLEAALKELRAAVITLELVKDPVAKKVEPGKVIRLKEQHAQRYSSSEPTVFGGAREFMVVSIDGPLAKLTPGQNTGREFTALVAHCEPV